MLYHLTHIVGYNVLHLILSRSCRSAAILERLVHNYLHDYRPIGYGVKSSNRKKKQTNKQTNPDQFRQLYSTTTALIKLTDDLLSDMNDSNHTGLVPIDLRRATDTVNHGAILQKLSAYSIDGRIHQWVTSYLTDQSQQVHINGIL